MPLKVGFAEVDITPPVGTLKIGWIIRIASDQVIDPLYARAAAIQSGRNSLGLISLDTLCVRWTQVAEIRRRISARYGFPGRNIMVAATHNHAGPAVKKFESTPRDEAYIETMISKVVESFGRALAGAEEAEIGFGSCFEFGVAHNRRVIMRDGTVRTHGSFSDPDSLCLEGPIDPEVGVMAARSMAGRPLGAVVTFACHPTHHGATGELSAGYPGALAREMKRRGWPVTVFLNGPSGNLHFADPTRNGDGMTKEQIGARLAEDAGKVIAQMEFGSEAILSGKKRTIQLPYRAVTKAEIKGTVRGAQRFVDSAAYDRAMPALLERIRTRGTQPAEVQALFINDHAFVSIPAEYFVQHGLRIKEAAHPRRALVVSCANGMVGYVPHKEAFRRGGYETTFGGGSMLAPKAGDLLADTAISLLRSGALWRRT
jgi:neutral ceramidase